MIKPNTYFVFSLITLIFLSGCDSTKELLGITDTQPDAFEVLDRAPLELPPEFNLKPPEPGKKRPQETSKRQIAAQHLQQSAQNTETQQPIKNPTRSGHYKTSHGQNAFLKKAKATPVETPLRNQMRAQEEADNQDSFLKKLVAEEKKEPVINPVQEQKRLA